MLVGQSQICLSASTSERSILAWPDINLYISFSLEAKSSLNTSTNRQTARFVWDFDMSDGFVSMPAGSRDGVGALSLWGRESFCSSDGSMGEPTGGKAILALPDWRSRGQKFFMTAEMLKDTSSMSQHEGCQEPSQNIDSYRSFPLWVWNFDMFPILRWEPCYFKIKFVAVPARRLLGLVGGSAEQERFAAGQRGNCSARAVSSVHSHLELKVAKMNGKYKATSRTRGLPGSQSTSEHEE